MPANTDFKTIDIAGEERAVPTMSVSKSKMCATASEFVPGKTDTEAPKLNFNPNAKEFSFNACASEWKPNASAQAWQPAVPVAANNSSAWNRRPAPAASCLQFNMNCFSSDSESDDDTPPPSPKLVAKAASAPNMMPPAAVQQEVNDVSPAKVHPLVSPSAMSVATTSSPRSAEESPRSAPETQESPRTPTNRSDTDESSGLASASEDEQAQPEKSNKGSSEWQPSVAGDVKRLFSYFEDDADMATAAKDWKTLKVENTASESTALEVLLKIAFDDSRKSRTVVDLLSGFLGKAECVEVEAVEATLELFEDLLEELEVDSPGAKAFYNDVQQVVENAKTKKSTTSETPVPDEEPIVEKLVGNAMVWSPAQMLQMRALAEGLRPDERYGAVAKETVVAKKTQTTTNAGPSWREESKAFQLRAGKKAETSKKLEESAGSWSAQVKQLKKSGGEGEACRKIKSILNKLTLEKFDSLCKQLITSCDLESQENVEFLMKDVFEKATTQHHFIGMYTDLCVYLNDVLSKQAEGTTQTSKKVNFKRILLNECQACFEKFLKPPEQLFSDDLQDEELFEAQTKYKTKMLGNLRFVGQLLSKKMLASRVLIAVAEELLRTPTNESLEALATFLTAVGPTFDNTNWVMHSQFKGIMMEVQKRAKDKGFSARTRFLLQDVCDLRATGWEDQKKATKKLEGPKKINAVHKSPRAEDGFQMVGSKSKATTPTSCPAKMMKDAPWRKSASQGVPSTGLSAAELLMANLQKRSPAQVTPIATSRHSLSSPKSTSPPGSARAPSPSIAAEVTMTLKELKANGDVDAAVKRIGNLNVPPQRQTEEFCDILARIFEEPKLPVRELQLSFAVGLFGSDVFSKDDFSDAVHHFFQDTYADLSEDVPDLKRIIKEEFIPKAESLLKKSQRESMLRLLSDE